MKGECSGHFRALCDSVIVDKAKPGYLSANSGESALLTNGNPSPQCRRDGAVYFLQILARARVQCPRFLGAKCGDQYC